MINSIQLLRALAALGVVFAHYELMGIKAGGFGVDIFFIISGFIIAFVVNNNTVNFMKKRVARVVPLYTLATILTAVLAIIKPGWFRNVVVNVESIVKSLFYIPYRIDNSGPILSLGWTLNNEMFFYVVMGGCILLVKNKKYLAIICGLIVMGMYLILNLLTVESYVLNFYKNGLLPEFVFGIILYYIWMFYKDRQRNSINTFVIFLGVLSLLFMIYTDITGEFREWSRNLWRGIPSLVLTFSFLVLERYIDPSKKVWKYLMELGDASYAMYLFHPFILFGFTRVLYPSLFPNTDNFFIEIFKFLTMLLVLCVVSVMIFRYIDKPLSYKTRKLLKA